MNDIRFDQRVDVMFVDTVSTKVEFLAFVHFTVFDPW